MRAKDVAFAAIATMELKSKPLKRKRPDSRGVRAVPQFVVRTAR